MRYLVTWEVRQSNGSYHQHGEGFAAIRDARRFARNRRLLSGTSGVHLVDTDTQELILLTD